MSRPSSTRSTAPCRWTSSAWTRSTIPFGGPTSPAGKGGAATSRLREVLARSIDDVGLSVRSVNSLKNSNIRTLGDLAQYREEDLLKVVDAGAAPQAQATEGDVE